ncbi:MAG: UPF0147 family protein [Candidatus Woesearchaeota archaeon]|jgi:uncharacterized protein (UPF0147 family)|nr:UPF0147 family protein [Candidatus Woesearchaeota archaeon]
MDTLQQAIFALHELEQDTTTPKNVKTKVASTLKILNENGEVSLKKSRAMHELEELSEDINVQSYTRTQLFNIVSLLEIV